MFAKVIDFSEQMLAFSKSICYCYRMDIFHTFFKSLTKPEREQFASKVGTSVAYLWQIAYKQRRCNESLAIEIEKHSMQKVRVEQLRPDVDWAYLRNSADSIANSPPINVNGKVDRSAASDDAQPPVGGSSGK
ncbi:YdaS family helix-turn-helix protein [Paraburkholderia tropica]|uniref:transcriptional regulator n=1 Tax=Paraburkholderia tropica TaxID=92647 RepID=UPI0030167C1F